MLRQRLPRCKKEQRQTRRTHRVVRVAKERPIGGDRSQFISTHIFVPLQANAPYFVTHMQSPDSIESIVGRTTYDRWKRTDAWKYTCCNSSVRADSSSSRTTVTIPIPHVHIERKARL